MYNHKVYACNDFISVSQCIHPVPILICLIALTVIVNTVGLIHNAHCEIVYFITGFILESYFLFILHSIVTISDI